MRKLISNQLSPNITFLDGLHAISQVLYIRKQIDYDFSEYFKTNNYFLANAARTGITKILETINLPKEKTIAIPAFCCAVMATPFISKGYKIEWIDTDKNGVIDFDDFIKKSENVGLVIVPHIFGQKAPIEKFYEYTRDKNIFVLEDCAHLFDVSTEFCDAKILSFGREKVLSCVSGGAVLWNDNSPYSEKLRCTGLATPPWKYTLKHILHPFLFSIILPIWNLGQSGKVIAWGLSKCRVFPRAVTLKEKKGIENYPQYRLPTAQQRILKRQFQRFEKIQKHRKEMAKKWETVLTKIFPDSEIIIPENSFRVLLKHNNPDEVRDECILFGFDLKEWNGNPIAPSGVDLTAFGYSPEQCPNAEYFSDNYLSFPTNIRINLSDIEFFRNYWRLIHGKSKPNKETPETTTTSS